MVQASWPIGWGMAALLYAAAFSLMPPEWAWRTMFWIGLLPALMVFWVRKHVPEPQVYQRGKQEGNASPFAIFAPGQLRTTLLCVLFASGIQGGYYAVTIWLPTFLRTSRGLSVFDTSGYLMVIIAGSWLGCMVAGHLADAIGRRRTFFLFGLAELAIVYVYTQLPMSNALMLGLGFPLGFFANGVFAPMGPFLTELFPTAMRATGQGFCFSAGRAIGALFPALVGYLSTAMPLEQAMGLFVGIAYALVFAALMMLPETRGRELDDTGAAEADDLPTPLAAPAVRP
jgi:MFS family permease